MRLIDADELIERAARMRLDTRERIIGMIHTAPTIEPVKRGKWLAIGNTGLAACSCGYITDRYSIYNYCPNCGARMENE